MVSLPVNPLGLGYRYAGYDWFFPPDVTSQYMELFAETTILTDISRQTEIWYYVGIAFVSGDNFMVGHLNTFGTRRLFIATYIDNVYEEYIGGEISKGYYIHIFEYQGWWHIMQFCSPHSWSLAVYLPDQEVEMIAVGGSTYSDMNRMSLKFHSMNAHINFRSMPLLTEDYGFVRCMFADPPYYLHGFKIEDGFSKFLVRGGHAEFFRRSTFGGGANRHQPR